MPELERWKKKAMKREGRYQNTVHKQYVQKLQELSAESLPKQEPNEPVKNQDQPAKVNQPGI